MISVTLERDYRCAPEGHTVESYKAGDVVTGRVAELALQDGAAKRIRAPRVTKPAAPNEAK